MKIRTGLKHPAAACSPELKIPMSELKVAVDIECGFSGSNAYLGADFLTICNQKTEYDLLRLEIGKKGKRGF